jgi:hypothetical protein
MSERHENLCVDSYRPNQMEDNLKRNEKWKTTTKIKKKKMTSKKMKDDLKTNKNWKTTSKKF